MSSALPDFGCSCQNYIIIGISIDDKFRHSPRIMLKYVSLTNLTRTASVNFGYKIRVHFWINNEFLFEIDTHCYYHKSNFYVGSIYQTSEIFVNSSKFNVSDIKEGFAIIGVILNSPLFRSMLLLKP